jgi:hypothetical protein
LSPPKLSPVQSLSKMVSKKRHALLGTACALGLVVAPLAGSAAVVGITAAPSAAPPSAQLAAQPAPAPLTPPAPSLTRGPRVERTR